jgi:hypothetical protein
MKRVFRYDPETGKVVEVTARRQPARKGPAMGAYSEGRPLVCETLGCHPDQAAEYREELRRNGIRGADVDNDGSLRFTSRKARRETMKLNRSHDRDGGYGDG